MNTHFLTALIAELKLTISKSFAYDQPAFLRRYGILVLPVGARQ
jgi:hypothetical protein